MIVLDASFRTSSPTVEQAPPPDLPEICLAGRSNVGKSSALNALVARRGLARVSKTPGRTRLLNFFDVQLASGKGPNRRTARVRLCDLPGYGFALAPKQERRTWAAMIERYLRERESLRGIVLLVDAYVGVQPKDREMMEYLSAPDVAGRPLIVAATKADRVPRTRRGGQLDRIARELGVTRSAVIPFSSEEEIGREELWGAICAAAGLLGRGERPPPAEAPEPGTP